MFKVEYEYNGRMMTFDFIFHSFWAASLKARDISNAFHTNAYVYNLHTGVYVAHYWGD